VSAFVVPREHVDALVALGLEGPRGRTVSPDHAWHGVSWFDERPDHTWLWAELDRHRRELTYETANDVGQMLWAENARSVRHRYEDADASGMVPEEADWGYQYRRPPVRLTAVEGLKLIASLRYQSCEHDGWEDSEAARFLDALEHVLIWRLDGMDEAPWVWGPEEVRQRQRAGL